MKKLRLLPLSLRTQAILVSLLTILVVQGTTFYIGRHLERLHTEYVTVNYLSTMIRTLRAAVANISPEFRQELIHNASQGRWYLHTHQLPRGSHYSWSYGKRHHEGMVQDRDASNEYRDNAKQSHYQSMSNPARPQPLQHPKSPSANAYGDPGSKTSHSSKSIKKDRDFSYA